MNETQKLDVRKDSLYRLSKHFGEFVKASTVLSLSNEDLEALRERANKVDKFWSILHANVTRWFLGITLTSWVGWFLLVYTGKDITGALVGSFLLADGVGLLALILGAATVSLFNSSACILKVALEPLSKRPWRCESALNLVKEWECCHQYRDEVLSRGRELLEADLRALDCLARDARREQSKEQERQTCARLHGLEVTA